MDDIDVPRCVPGAAEQILDTLRALGFVWDGEVVYQSRRTDAYRAAFERLTEAGCIFPCACTRRQLASSGGTTIDGGQLYDGRCRDSLPPGEPPRAWRLRVPAAEIAFDDAIQGMLSQQLQRDVGDFVVLRADGLFAYQLAVVVDDGEQGISHIVRGADLVDSTPRQVLLQQLLGLPTPWYAHLPVAIDGAGQKLSKQTLATPIDVKQPLTTMMAAWSFLGQSWQQGHEPDSLEAFWPEAIRQWQIKRVPNQRQLSAPDYSR